MVLGHSESPECHLLSFLRQNRQHQLKRLTFTRFYPILSVFRPSAHIPPGRFLSKNRDDSGQSYPGKPHYPLWEACLSPGLSLISVAARGERMDDVSGTGCRRGVPGVGVVPDRVVLGQGTVGGGSTPCTWSRTLTKWSRTGPEQ